MSYMGRKYLEGLKRGFNTAELAKAYRVPEHEICAEMELARAVEREDEGAKAHKRLPYAGKQRGGTI